MAMVKVKRKKTVLPPNDQAYSSLRLLSTSLLVASLRTPQEMADQDLKYIFCVACANKAFGAALVCPACEASLTQQDDVVFVELNPGQEYRSSILSGLRPEVIMEICTRAISFWTYQTSQEAKYQEMIQKTLEDKLSLCEKQQQRMIREVNAELNGFRNKMNSLQKDLEQEKRKTADFSEQLDEKSRLLSKFQTLYERQKRRPLFADMPKYSHQTQERDAMLSNTGDPYRLYQSLDLDPPKQLGHDHAPLPHAPPLIFATAPSPASVPFYPLPSQEARPFVYDRPSSFGSQCKILSQHRSSLQRDSDNSARSVQRNMELRSYSNRSIGWQVSGQNAGQPGPVPAAPRMMSSSESS
ncbi:hypothetical protein BC939DRAFT_515604 [Gamsiella multidivaricata]|uniref:uncharacterized protein n=1 Tax=Gamsiella multidivaricata TaxID=101098 RepID=UPI002220EA38|nr:uncharacterized protein BC939DRAFT_515604 [Gamsiella multidivaricata]KAI7824675.1 hypothetical protein BC939DRAFT_515604 [Gamsiella multidivaricata]